MPLVFTEQQAALQRVDADQRVLQATLRQNESQSKNIVWVFAWCQDNCEPVSFDFSLPPGSRNFQITESVLHDLALIQEFFSRLCKQYIIFQLFSYVNEIKEPNN